jgi:hypothetical protein
MMGNGVSRVSPIFYDAVWVNTPLHTFTELGVHPMGHVQQLKRGDRPSRACAQELARVTIRKTCVFPM